MKRILLLACAVMLANCSEQPQTAVSQTKSGAPSLKKHGMDAFKFAKSHVWGDAKRGCGYQQLMFTEKHYLKLNSDQLINNRKKEKLSQHILEKENLYDVDKIELKPEKFILSLNSWNTKIEFTLIGNELKRTGVYDNGVWFDIVDNNYTLNKYHPVSFKICDKEAIEKGKFDGK